MDLSCSNVVSQHSGAICFPSSEHISDKYFTLKKIYVGLKCLHFCFGDSSSNGFSKPEKSCSHVRLMRNIVPCLNPALI